MNKHFSKFLAASVTAAVVATAALPASAASITFKDENLFGSHSENIYIAAERGLVKGVNGYFNPNNNITRGQVVKTLARYIEETYGEIDTSATAPFKDVTSAHPDQELYKASLVVKEFEVFNGVNNSLLPNNQISRQAMAKVLVEAFGLYEYINEDSQVVITDLEQADEWAREYIEKLAELEITTVSAFKPKANVSRAQYASFLVRTIEGVEWAEEFEVIGVDSVTVNQGEAPVLPETVTFRYNDGYEVELPVSWDKVDTSQPGVYEVKGSVDETGHEVAIQVTVTQ
ncbi:hypothetical protein JOC78_002229 [Bacillus ectoiniformans]|uniref:S-layer homology domain-containing protein n=1 Tax=Bacillus ectoiniformans TaxID=1494429 RepID=UPI0019570706|nr:S-layer homology domain-containing protein [Bacillus ectoiniformans]MBM7649276.1 hypothetical protein [Bacillus ectoiniformans]